MQQAAIEELLKLLIWMHVVSPKGAFRIPLPSSLSVAQMQPHSLASFFSFPVIRFWVLGVRLSLASLGACEPSVHRQTRCQTTVCVRFGWTVLYVTTVVGWSTIVYSLHLWMQPLYAAPWYQNDYSEIYIQGSFWSLLILAPNLTNYRRMDGTSDIHSPSQSVALTMIIVSFNFVLSTDRL